VLHTKTFQGLLGDLPESWLKKEGVPGVPKALTGGSGGGRDNRSQGEGGGGNKVTNPRPDRDLVRRWEASGLTSVQQLLAKYSGEMPMVLPKFGGDEACLTYILKKECYGNCQRKGTHKHAGAQVVTAVNKFLDDCQVAA